MNSVKVSAGDTSSFPAEMDWCPVNIKQSLKQLLYATILFTKLYICWGFKTNFTPYIISHCLT